MLVNYLAINLMHQFDVSARDGLPLGHEDWAGSLIKTEKLPVGISEKGARVGPSGEKCGLHVV